MNTMKPLFVIIILTVLYGCHGDFCELGDGYIWIEKMIGFTTDERTGTFEPVVYQEITEYNNDLNFIIAHQTMGEMAEELILSSIRYSKMNEADSLWILYSKMLRIKECYWIIDKKKHLVFGPMEKSDYFKKKKKLRIEMELNSLH